MDKTHQILIKTEVIFVWPELMSTPLLHFIEAQEGTLGIGVQKKTLMGLGRGQLNSSIYETNQNLSFNWIPV